MTTSHFNKNIIISFRLTPTQAARIEAAASAGKAKRTRSDWCRAVALYVAKQKVPEPVAPRRRPARRKPTADIEILAKILGQIGKIGGNLNQLARQANKAGDLPTKAELQQISEKIGRISRAVQSALSGKGGDDGD